MLLSLNCFYEACVAWEQAFSYWNLKFAVLKAFACEIVDFSNAGVQF